MIVVVLPWPRDWDLFSNLPFALFQILEKKDGGKCINFCQSNSLSGYDSVLSTVFVRQLNPEEELMHLEPQIHSSPAIGGSFTLKYGFCDCPLPKCLLDFLPGSLDKPFAVQVEQILPSDWMPLLEFLRQLAGFQVESKQKAKRRANNLRKLLESHIWNINKVQKPRVIESHAELEGRWASYADFLTSDATQLFDKPFVWDTKPGFNSQIVKTSDAIVKIQYEVRQRIHYAIKCGAIIGSLTGFLRRPPAPPSKHTIDKIYVNRGQVANQLALEAMQTMKYHLIWVARHESLTSADAGSDIWSLGLVRLVQSSSLNKTRLSVAPLLPRLADEGSQDVPVVVLLLQDVHEQIFTLSSLQAAKSSFEDENKQEDHTETAASLPMRLFLGLESAPTLPRSSGCALSAVLRRSFGEKHVSDEQAEALSLLQRRQLSVVNCLAGAGKTTLLVARVADALSDANRLQRCGDKRPVIVVATANKALVLSLTKLLKKASPEHLIAPLGHVADAVKDNEYVDLLDTFLGDSMLETSASWIDGQKLVDKAANLIKFLTEQVQQANSSDSSALWSRNWEKLCRIHEALHLFLDSNVYAMEVELKRDTLGQIDVVVCSCSYLRKLLGGLSPWSKTFKQVFQLEELHVDETHHEGWTKLASLICHFSKVSLFGDRDQKPDPFQPESKQISYGEQSPDVADTVGSYSWLSWAKYPDIRLSHSFRIGPELCSALTYAGIVPDARSMADHETHLLLNVFSSSECAMRALPKFDEVFYHELMFQHLLMLLVLEVVSAVVKGGDVESKRIFVLVFYKAMERQLMENLKWFLTKLLQVCFRSKLSDPEMMACLAFVDSSVEICMSQPAGGLECSVSFILVPRRRRSDNTWHGRHLCGKSWQYIALTRASRRTYLFLEDFKTSTERGGSWQRLLDRGRQLLRNTWQIPSHPPIKSKCCLPHVCLSSKWAEMLQLTDLHSESFFEQLLKEIGQTVAYFHSTLARVPNSTSPMQPPKLSDLMTDIGLLQSLIDQHNSWNTECQRLPRLETFYPTCTAGACEQDVESVKRLSEEQLWDMKYQILDAVTIHVRDNMIVMSLPVLNDPRPNQRNDASLIACYLYNLWDVSEYDCIKRLTRHKKSELTVGDGEFVEAQCGSDRPAFCVYSTETDEEVFHLYNAMGLKYQHADVRTILARILGKDRQVLAISFLRHLVKKAGVQYRLGQLSCFSDEAKKSWLEACDLDAAPPHVPLQDCLQVFEGDMPEPEGI